MPAARRPLRGIYEGFPLLCPRCGEPMKLIAFVTEVNPLKRIPEHLGEPTYLPGIARAARDPSDGDGDFDTRERNMFARSEPLPEYELDQPGKRAGAFPLCTSSTKATGPARAGRALGLAWPGSGELSGTQRWQSFARTRVHPPSGPPNQRPVRRNHTRCKAALNFLYFSLWAETCFARRTSIQSELGLWRIICTHSLSCRAT
jgi:hypothetical protein